jgi:cytochrome c-type biogenesis protein CcmE
MTDAQRQRRLWYVIGGVLIAAFLVFGANAFKQNLTPYVGFEEAMRSAGKVQVAGKLVPDSAEYVEGTERLKFGITDDQGRTMTVVYDGAKPGNFEEATQIVVIGSFGDGVFHAEEMLVKCPSKYQGIEQAET